MNKNIKYVVCPGHISGNNNQLHYIDAPELMRLYKVNPNECVVWKENLPIHLKSLYNELIALTPRMDGRYVIPEEKVDIKKRQEILSKMISSGIPYHVIRKKSND